MKKILVVLAMAAYASTAFASIAGSPHDLTTRPGATVTMGSCQYCHAPHLWTPPTDTTLIGVAPLWNRNASTATFTPYTSATLNDSVVSIGPNSKTCLSCHDAVTNMGVVLNGTSNSSIGAMAALSYANVGTALTDDHPVGVQYSIAQAAHPTEYRATPTAPVALKAGQVECGSCHDPHGTWDAARGGLAFLLTPQASLCVACHTK